MYVFFFILLELFFCFVEDIVCYSTDRVLNEVRDPESRRFLANFPYPIRTKNPSPQSLRNGNEQQRKFRHQQNLFEKKGEKTETKMFV